MANPTDKVNKNSNFVRVSGKTAMEYVTLTASVAVEDGSILYPDPVTAGQYTKGDSTAGDRFVVIRQTIASTDADYASTKKVLVESPIENDVVWEFTVGSGTFTSADVAKYADLSSEKAVAVDTSTKKQLFITGYISATRGLCTFAGNVGSGMALPVTS
jgi:hypothetical protein